jgi:ribonuclease R
LKQYLRVPEYRGVPESLETIARQCSERSTRADRAQREFDTWRTLQFLARHVGKTFEAHIERVNGGGFTVHLPSYGLSTLLPFSHLPGHGKAAQHEAFGVCDVSTGKRWEVGMRIRVLLQGIDWHRRQPLLVWVDDAPFSQCAA